MHRKQFLLLGDSLTQQSYDFGGWGGRLTSQYQRKADVTLRGFSGYNTRWINHILNEILPEKLSSSHYDLATLWFGANDAALPDRYNKRQHVPLPEYQANLNTFIDRLQAFGAQVVIITPPPVDEAARIKLAKQDGAVGPERTLEMSGQYATAAKEVASKRGLPYLDLWTKLQAVPNWQSLLTDGLHFAPEGNEKVFELLAELISSDLPHFKPENLPTDFPFSVDINADNFAASFNTHAQRHF